MARVHSLKYILSFTCSIALNLFLVSMFIRNRCQQNWTQEAMAEAEAVSSISCSGHGKAFLDGLLLHGKHVCECNMCYGGSDCSQLLPDCGHIVKFCHDSTCCGKLQTNAADVANNCNHHADIMNPKILQLRLKLKSQLFLKL